MNAGDPPERMLGIEGPLERELAHVAREIQAALAGELLVQRLLPPEEAHGY